VSELDLFLDRARESLRAARILIREDLPNIAASRAYYAMFYIAEAMLLSRDLAFSSHSAVIAAYGKEFARSNDLDPKFHRYLIASLDMRQTGDYGVENNVSLAEASQVTAWAEEFLNTAVAFLGQ
jgi:uncharacterized protein (UPF0332 family)